MQHPQKKPDKRRAGKRAAIIAICALAALASAFVLLLPALRAAYPKSGTVLNERSKEYRTLESRGASELSSVTVTHADGGGYALINANGRLMLDAGDELKELSELAQSEISDALADISVEGMVAESAAEVSAHLADMGLEPPRATAVLRYADGSETRLELGGAVYGTSYSYFRWSGDDGVYMCDAGMEDALMYTAGRLLPVAQPVLEKSLIDSVTLTLKDGGVIEMSLGVDSSGTATGRMLAPYAYPMSADAAQTVLGAVCDLRLGTPINDTSGGFDTPTLIIDAHMRAGARTAVDSEGQLYYEELPEAGFRFTLGDAQGDYYYACRYEGASYLVSRFLCEALVSADAAQMATRNPADIGAEPQSVKVVTEGGELNASIARTERVLPNNQLETDTDGNIIYDARAEINGAEVTEEQYASLADRLKGMAVSGSLPEGWMPGDTPARWSIELKGADGGVRVIKAYRLDAFSDALSVDGVALHYVSAEALQIALGEWMP